MECTAGVGRQGGGADKCTAKEGALRHRCWNWPWQPSGRGNPPCRPACHRSWRGGLPGLPRCPPHHCIAGVSSRSNPKQRPHPHNFDTPTAPTPSQRPHPNSAHTLTAPMPCQRPYPNSAHTLTAPTP
eukprot:359863-Chlamydomonas_euryale.AAC.1